MDEPKKPSSPIEGMYTLVLQSSAPAVVAALRSGLVVPNDLNEKNEAHLHAVVSFVDTEARLASVPMRQIMAVPSHVIVTWCYRYETDVVFDQLVDRYEAATVPFQTQMIALISERVGTEDTGSTPVAVRRAAALASLIEERVADIDATTDRVWESARGNLGKIRPDFEAKLVSLRAKAKRKRTELARVQEVAAGKTPTSTTPPAKDPLYEALSAGNVNRLKGLALASLNPDRWKKFKAMWLAHPDVEIRSQLVRVPKELLGDALYGALDACIDNAVQNDGLDQYIWRMAMPHFPVPVAYLHQAEPDRCLNWLRLLFGNNTGLAVEPIMELATLRDELILDALCHADMQALAERLSFLARFRKVMRLSRDAKAERVLAAELPHLDAVIYGLWDETVRETSFLVPMSRTDFRIHELFGWCIGLPRQEALATARMISEHEVFDRIVNSLFRSEQIPKLVVSLPEDEDLMKKVEVKDRAAL